MAMAASAPAGVEIRGTMRAGYDRILTLDAIAFIAQLERSFGPERKRLLAARAERQLRLDAGAKPDFPAETRAIREADWTVAPLPKDLLDRRVEITGPIDRKMVINALNSGANVYMADFEDASTPSWDNLIDGHINLRDAVRRDIAYRRPAERPALHARAPRLRRSWCGRAAGTCPRRTCWSTATPMSGSLFDFGLYFFHNAKELIRRGTGPYFYLAKLESRHEAKLWNDVFVASQKALGIANGTIKATVLIETILAAFEMDEILHALKDHSAGLNCGRWDYIYSYIKKFAEDAACVLPDRAQVTMTAAFPTLLQPRADQDLPPPQRPRDGRHGGANPDPRRPRGQRSGDGEGARRQAARGGRRA